MTTFAVGLEGKTEKPYGPGAKIVEGTITGGQTVNAKDIGLKTIHTLYAHSGKGTQIAVHVGTFTAGDIAAENYATMRSYAPGSSGGVYIGTYRIFAIGE